MFIVIIAAVGTAVWSGLVVTEGGGAGQGAQVF